MSFDPKAPESIEWQGGAGRGGEEGDEGGDELSRTSAPIVETTVTHLAQTHSANQTTRFPVRFGFVEKYGKGRRPGRR